jgi:hypothetical protein
MEGVILKTPFGRPTTDVILKIGKFQRSECYVVSGEEALGLGPGVTYAAKGKTFTVRGWRGGVWLFSWNGRNWVSESLAKGRALHIYRAFESDMRKLPGFCEAVPHA